jgi:hypothetical protein
MNAELPGRDELKLGKGLEGGRAEVVRDVKA